MKQSTNQFGSARGFTLVEMIIVVMILAILATVAVPLLTAADGIKSHAVAIRITDILAHARMESVKLGKSVTVYFDVVTSEVSLIQFTGLDPLPTEPGGYSVNLSTEYQTQVGLTTIGLSNNKIKFRSDGSATDSESDLLIGFTARIVNTVGEHSTEVKINPITGLATIIE